MRSELCEYSNERERRAKREGERAAIERAVAVIERGRPADLEAASAKGNKIAE